MPCIRCQQGIAKKFGTYGKARIQRFRCDTCRATFSTPHERPLGRHYLDTAKAFQVIALLTEGMTVHPISRISCVHKSTIFSLMLTADHRGPLRLHPPPPLPHPLVYP